MALLKAIPGAQTAFFSILSPRMHIPAHCGPYKGVIRCHLGLVVPKPERDCRLRVADTIAHWEEARKDFVTVGDWHNTCYTTPYIPYQAPAASSS